jgi:7-carboxy-7-deazaguanine synthase
MTDATAVPAVLVPDPVPLGMPTIEPPASWSTHLPVNEVFGPVIQGEGPYAGRRASFVRLGGQAPGQGCNLHCEDCDTKGTWHPGWDLPAENPMTYVDTVVHQLGRHNTPYTIISGGEPLLHQQRLAWERLLRGINNLGGAGSLGGGIHIETNGTIAPNDVTRFAVRHFTVSPKLRAMGSADPQGKRIKPEVIDRFRELADAGAAIFKIVCAARDDVEEAASFADTHGIRREHVWVMPLGTKPSALQQVSESIGKETVLMGMSFTGRLHLAMGVR